jgi:hypothetical protein
MSQNTNLQNTNLQNTHLQNPNPISVQNTHNSAHKTLPPSFPPSLPPSVPALPACWTYRSSWERIRKNWEEEQREMLEMKNREEIERKFNQYVEVLDACAMKYEEELRAREMELKEREERVTEAMVRIR